MGDNEIHAGKIGGYLVDDRREAVVYVWSGVAAEHNHDGYAVFLAFGVHGVEAGVVAVHGGSYGTGFQHHTLERTVQHSAVQLMYGPAPVQRVQAGKAKKTRGVGFHQPDDGVIAHTSCEVFHATGSYAHIYAVPVHIFKHELHGLLGNGRSKFAADIGCVTFAASLVFIHTQRGIIFKRRAQTEINNHGQSPGTEFGAGLEGKSGAGDSAAEIGANAFLVDGGGDGITGGFDDFEQPCHITTEYLHGLDAFLVLSEKLFGGPAEDDVPVLAVHRDEVGTVEIVAELLGGIDCSRSAAYRNGCGGLRPPAFQMFRGVKQTVENTLERTGDTHVMHGTSDDKAIIFRQHVNERVAQVGIRRRSIAQHVVERIRHGVIG